MGYARKNLVSLQDTPYYHCIGRCVRRAWLWGRDAYSGKAAPSIHASAAFVHPCTSDYSHRKQWVLERLEQLCSIFARVGAYGCMM